MFQEFLKKSHKTFKTFKSLVLTKTFETCKRQSALCENYHLCRILHIVRYHHQYYKGHHVSGNSVALKVFFTSFVAGESNDRLSKLEPHIHNLRTFLYQGWLFFKARLTLCTTVQYQNPHMMIPRTHFNSAAQFDN